MQSPASAVPFSFKMHAIPCKHWDEVAGQEALVVLDVWRWPPLSPERDSAPAAAAPPRRWLHRRGQLAGPPRRPSTSLPPPWAAETRI